MITCYRLDFELFTGGPGWGHGGLSQGGNRSKGRIDWPETAHSPICAQAKDCNGGAKMPTKIDPAPCPTAASGSPLPSSRGCIPGGRLPVEGA